MTSILQSVNATITRRPWKLVVLELEIVALYFYPIGAANTAAGLAITVALLYERQPKFFVKLGLSTLALSTSASILRERSSIPEAAAVGSFYFFGLALCLSLAEHWRIAGRARQLAVTFLTNVLAIMTALVTAIRATAALLLRGLITAIRNSLQRIAVPARAAATFLLRGLSYAVSVISRQFQRLITAFGNGLQAIGAQHFFKRRRPEPERGDGVPADRFPYNKPGRHAAPLSLGPVTVVGNVLHRQGDSISRVENTVLTRLVRLMPGIKQRSVQIQRITAGMLLIAIGAFQLLSGGQTLSGLLAVPGNPEIAKAQQRQGQTRSMKSKLALTIRDASGSHVLAPKIASLLSSKGLRVAEITTEPEPTRDPVIRYLPGWVELAREVRAALPNGKGYSLMETNHLESSAQIELVVGPPEMTLSGAALDPTLSSVNVRILNGSGVAGDAARTAAELKPLGYQIVSIANAPSMDHDKTTITYRPGYRAVASGLVETLAGREPQLVRDSSSSEIVVILLGRGKRAD